MPSFDLPTLPEMQTPSESTPVNSATTAKTVAEWFLCWTSKDGQNRQALITKQPLKIGNSPRCEIQLDSLEAKPLHVVISLNEETVTARSWVEETELNGEDFATADLEDDDKLSIAGQEFQVLQTATQETSDEKVDVDTDFEGLAELPADFESKLRDRIALNYQRIKRLVGTLRLERRDGVDAFSRVTDLEQSLLELNSQLESASEENESLRSTSLELEQALLEAHEYLTSIKEQELTSEEPVSESSSAVVDQPSEDFNSDSNELIDSEATQSLPYEYEEDIVEEESQPTIDEEIDLPEEDVEEEAFDSLTSFDDVEIPTPYAVVEEEEITPSEEGTETANLEDEPVEQEFSEPIWQVEESYEEPSENLEEFSTSEEITAINDDRIDDLFGHQLDKESDNGQPFEPASFIDKYASLEEPDQTQSFSEDSQPEESAELTSLPQEDIAYEMSHQESDDSMDDYLQKMMARIAGGTPDAEETSVNIAPTHESIVSENQKETIPSTEQEELPKFQDLSELCKSLAPEAETDMQSLRSLANDSARKAIQTAQANQWRANVVRRFGAVGIGLIGSIVGLVTAPSLVSPQAILCICLITAWGYAGLRAVLKSQSDATLDIDFKTDLSEAKA